MMRSCKVSFYYWTLETSVERNSSFLVSSALVGLSPFRLPSTSSKSLSIDKFALLRTLNSEERLFVEI